ncbi:MAG TPA: S41 family peptidase [Fimbriimonadaceae bacterium]|nr:S41 family peptidase [Fimbriimonadaceae bacterium]
MLALAVSIAFVSQSPDTSAAGLAKDYAILKQAYTALHPGLLRYNSQAQLDAHFAVLEMAWSRDQTLQEAFLFLSEFTAKIKCGHTYPNFFNQTEFTKKELFERKDKVPFTFRWLDRRMFVTRDCTGSNLLPRGTEILSINSVPVSTILNRLMGIARADGSNDAKRMDYLGVSGGGKYEAFDIYHPLYFPVKGNLFNFTVRKPGAETAQVEAGPISIGDRVEPNQPKVEKDSPLWSVEYPRDKVAVLKMPTWAMYNSSWNWRGFLKTTFASLIEQGTPNLIIDLRGNEGGDSVGNSILPYLTDRPLPRESVRSLSRYQVVQDDLRPYLDTWDKQFFDARAITKPTGDGFFEVTRGGSSAAIRPAETLYKGKVFVLAGPANSSATFLFAKQVKQYSLATLVGQPTGGNQRGITGGAFFFLRLPNSKLEVDLPLIAQFFPGSPPDAGIEPDVLVKPNARDVETGSDTEIERTFQIISSKNLPERGTTALKLTE